jgi:hypothetical protein
MNISLNPSRGGKEQIYRKVDFDCSEFLPAQRIIDGLIQVILGMVALGMLASLRLVC